MTTLIRIAFLSTLMLASTPAAPAPTPDKLEVYKTVGTTQLQLGIFNPANHKPSDKSPCIVFFFGGGWVSGTMSQFYPASRYLADRGMVAICADYRVNSRQHVTPFECVQDAKSAMRWVRGHASELGIDPHRIAAGGGSAGGHLAAAAATTTGFNTPGEDPTVSCRPDALVLFNPVIDNGPGGYGYDRVQARWQKFSPMNNLKKGDPPTVLFYGTMDKFVPVTTAQKYQSLMQKNGDRCELHLYEGEPHGFFNPSNEGGKYFRLTMLEADKFLASLGYLQGPPRLDLLK